MPPWTLPTEYCTSMAGIWWDGSPNATASNKLFGLDANGATLFGHQPDFDGKLSTTSWTSDNVFCMTGAAQFWETCLFIALAFWGFFTVLQLFKALDIRHGHGHTMAQTVNIMLRHIVVLILAISSFFLMLLLHQLLFLIVQTIVGGNLPQWRLDSLWVPGFTEPSRQVAAGGNVAAILSATQVLVSNSDIFTNIINAFSNGNAAGQNQILGTTFGQLFNAIPSLEGTLLQGWPIIDFFITYLLTCIAPIAIVFMAFEYTRPAFNLWLKSATELAGMTLLSAATVGVCQHLLCGGQACNLLGGQQDYYTHPSSPAYHVGPATLAWLFLAFGGVAVGLEIAYMWRLVGSLINFGVSASQAEYNRVVGEVKAILNAVGFLGTAFGGVIGLIGGTVAAQRIGNTVSAAGNAVYNTGQGVMSMIPQGNGTTLAPLPPYTERGLANSRFEQSAVYTDTGEPVTPADLAAATAVPRRRRRAVTHGYDARWRGGVTFSRAYTVSIPDGRGGTREVRVTEGRAIGRPDIPDNLTASQIQAAFMGGILRATAYERNHAPAALPDGTLVVGLNSPLNPTPRQQIANSPAQAHGGPGFQAVQQNPNLQAQMTGSTTTPSLAQQQQQQQQQPDPPKTPQTKQQHPTPLPAPTSTQASRWVLPFYSFPKGPHIPTFTQVDTLNNRWRDVLALKNGTFRYSEWNEGSPPRPAQPDSNP